MQGRRWYERPEVQVIQSKRCNDQIEERSNSIFFKTKLRLYKTLVVLVLLYGCRTWKMNKGDVKAIDVFHSKCL